MSLVLKDKRSWKLFVIQLLGLLFFETDRHMLQLFSGRVCHYCRVLSFDICLFILSGCTGKIDNGALALSTRGGSSEASDCVADSSYGRPRGDIAALRGTYFVFPDGYPPSPLPPLSHLPSLSSKHNKGSFL